MVMLLLLIMLSILLASTVLSVLVLGRLGTSLSAAVLFGSMGQCALSLLGGSLGCISRSQYGTFDDFVF